MANTSEIRNGLCLKHSNDIWIVVEFQHVKPGKGAAFVRTKLKSITHGRVVDNTWPSSHKIDIVRVVRRKFQYLYNDEMGFHFMDNETFEQISLPKERITNYQFLKESAQIEILYNSDTDEALTIELPQYVQLEITYTEPGMKGDTATNAMKPATTETGAEIRVPLFINEGDVVKIETKTGAYQERVKK